jgi:hypothetical protein
MAQKPDPHPVRVFIGAPVRDRTERRFLARAIRHLEAIGESAVIMANFDVGPDHRQVDFLIATARQAVAIEVKGFRHAVTGAENGQWTMKIGAETRSVGFPYEQALRNRFSLTDLLRSSLPRRNDARQAIAGMLCLFPEAPAGSSVPSSNHKLTVGGFPAFATLLGTASALPLPLEHWEEIARSLNLTPLDESSDDPQTAIIDEFLAYTANLAESTAGPFVEAVVEEEEGQGPLPPLIPLLAKGTHVHIVGPSGVGKTRLVARLTADAARNGLVPLTVAARDFDGALLPLLRKAVARSTSYRLEALMQAAEAKARTVLVCVDALNECPRGRLPDLLAALQTISLRYGATILLTGQALPELPASLSGRVVSLSQPTRERAKVLVEAHLGRPLDVSEQSMLEIVSSAQDASVLAEVLATHSTVDGRFALYDAFTSDRLPDDSHRHELHKALGDLAITMREAYSTRIGEPGAARLLGRAGRDAAAGSKLLAEAQRGALLISDAGSVRFRHDLIADYFSADYLLRNAQDISDLLRLSTRPINAELREFVLGGCSTTEEALHLLDADLPFSVIDAALSGRCGAVPRTLMLDRCRDVIDRIEAAYSQLEFSLPLEADGLPVRAAMSFSQPFELTPRELKAAFALSVAVNAGLFDRLMRTLAVVDARLWAEARRLRQENPELKRNIPGMVFGSLYGEHFQPKGARLLRHLFSNIVNERIWRQEASVSVDLNAELDDFEKKSPGQLFLLLAMHRAYLDIDISLPKRAAELVQHVWKLGIYHLRLMLMDLIHFTGRRAPQEQRQEIYDILMGFLSDNAWMNAILMDAISAVGDIPFGLTVENILADYEQIAGEPLSDETARRALSSYSCTYDHPASDLFCEAFNERLSNEQRSAVLVRALNDPTAASMSLEFAMRELGRYPSEESIPVLTQYSFVPKQDTESAQSSVVCFVEAIAQLARLGQPLIPIGDLSSDPDIRAWQGVRQLIHSFNCSPQPASEDIDAQWAAFRDAGDGAAMDVLLKIHESQVFPGDVRLDFATSCRDGLRALCLAVMEPEYVASSMFLRMLLEPGKAGRAERQAEMLRSHRRYALSCLGLVGRSSDRERIERWREDPQLGESAVRALRSIESR